MNSFENALKESLTQLMDSHDLTVVESQEHTFSSEYEKNIADICKQYSLPANRFAQSAQKSPKIIAWHKIAIAVCAVAACLLFSFLAVPAIKNAISDSKDEITNPDISYITMQVEENAMFCPAYTPYGFSIFNAEFEEDASLGGVIEYSNAKGDIITFSYKKSSGETINGDGCDIISIGSFKGYFDEGENSLTWEEYGYILRISGIADADEMHKIACDVKHKDKISIDFKTTTTVSKITEPIRVTTNRTETQSQSDNTIITTTTQQAPQHIVHTSTFFVPAATTTTTTQQAPQQIVHTGTFFVPVVTTTATSCGTTYTAHTTSTVTTAPNSSQTVTEITFTSALTTAAVTEATTQTTLPAATTTVFTTTTTTFIDDSIEASPAPTTTTEEDPIADGTAPTTTTTTTWPRYIEAEVKEWRPYYGDSRVSDTYETTEYPCMTIVHSMEQLESLTGTIFEINLEEMNPYFCTLEEGYLSEEFFAEHDFVIILSYETSGSYKYGVQSVKIATNHILEVVLSHYAPNVYTDDMSMQAKGIAVPKGSLNQVGSYTITWEYFGHDYNVPEGNESSTAYEKSIPDVLYIENEFAEE